MIRNQAKWKEKCSTKTMKFRKEYMINIETNNKSSK
jgi:hypothetical protein